MQTSKNIASERTFFVPPPQLRPSRETVTRVQWGASIRVYETSSKPRPVQVSGLHVFLSVALMKAMTKPGFPGGRSKEEVSD
ncbi:hypothetical protein Bpfe_020823 [Biomphalaria pfeifferi]|uniref:Uncharacterized protein n=1 Tax=Biomphalaria pfeifferi TaxID=112525 RepID=A0AAD8F2Y7_BIOPF|nr:hypothetical protein Bpfe_020823 [Biomphalaria pfeifferi]